MLAQSLRVSRCVVGRSAIRQTVLTRSFITTTIRQADIVSDIYLRELKSYKPKTESALSVESQVKKWSAPAPPPLPESANAGIADDLSAYESQVVEIEGQASADGAAAAQAEEDWFEEEVAFGGENDAHH